MRVIDGGRSAAGGAVGSGPLVWDRERDALIDRTHLSFRRQAEWLVQSEDLDERRRQVALVALALEANYIEGMRAFAIARHIGSPVVLKELEKSVRETAHPLTLGDVR